MADGQRVARAPRSPAGSRFCAHGARRFPTRGTAATPPASEDGLQICIYLCSCSLRANVLEDFLHSLLLLQHFRRLPFNKRARPLHFRYCILDNIDGRWVKIFQTFSFTFDIDIQIRRLKCHVKEKKKKTLGRGDQRMRSCRFRGRTLSVPIH